MSQPKVAFAKGAVDDLASYLADRGNDVVLRDAILAQAQLLSANPKLGREYRGPGNLRFHVFQVSGAKKVYIARLTYEIASADQIIILSCGPAEL